MELARSGTSRRTLNIGDDLGWWGQSLWSGAPWELDFAIGFGEQGADGRGLGGDGREGTALGGTLGAAVMRGGDGLGDWFGHCVWRGMV